MLKKIFLIMPIFFLCSCGKQEKEFTREEAIHEGVQLMEEGRFEESLSYFQDLYQRDPHPQVQQVWASVYAARAGVRIKHLVGLAKELSNIKDLSNEKNVVSFLGKIKSTWKYIPSVDEEGGQDLDQAVKILSAKTPEVRLYSAVLRGIRIKSLIDRGAETWKGFSHQVCGDDVEKLSQWVGQVYGRMNLVLQDMEVAIPSEALHYEELQNSVRQVQMRLQNSQASVCL